MRNLSLNHEANWDLGSQFCRILAADGQAGPVVKNLSYLSNLENF